MQFFNLIRNSDFLRSIRQTGKKKRIKRHTYAFEDFFTEVNETEANEQSSA